MTRAIEEIRETVQLAVSTLFFVEDTSLRIEALSDPRQEVPGLHVKDWFARTSFRAAKYSAQSSWDVRAATVKSDIALHVPNLGHPLFFHGETTGTVANTPPQFKPSIENPWLRPDSFNGWFIPDGADRALGAMMVEESWPQLSCESSHRPDQQAQGIRGRLEPPDGGEHTACEASSSA